MGDHVTQKGSLVSEEKLRFDFSHPKPLSNDDIAAIETQVNDEIRSNETVATGLMSPDDAVTAGALALFGEKYGDEVRVLSMGRKSGEGRNYSVELCGGTHVEATGEIGVFRIISESAVSSGIRRIEALTGDAARLWLVERDEALRDVAALVKAAPGDAVDRVRSLLDERKRLEKELADAKRAAALSGNNVSVDDSAADEKIGGLAFSGRVIEGLPAKELRGVLDQEKSRLGSGVAALVAVNDGRAAVAVAVTDDLTGQVDAVALVQSGVSAVGGKGGGGRADMAQGGGPDGARANDAIAAIRTALETSLRQAAQ